MNLLSNLRKVIRNLRVAAVHHRLKAVVAIPTQMAVFANLRKATENSRSAIKS